MESVYARLVSDFDSFGEKNGRMSVVAVLWCILGAPLKIVKVILTVGVLDGHSLFSLLGTFSAWYVYRIIGQQSAN